MAYNDEHIFQLILEKLSGEISDENRLYLEQAAREDDKIRRCLEEMEEASQVAGPEFMDDVYNEIAWSNVLSLLDNEHPANHIITASTPEEKTPEIPVETVPVKKPFTSQTWWIAAVTITAISSLLFFLPGRTNKSATINTLAYNNNIAIPLKGNIQLLLDNGDTVQLPDNEGEVISMAQVSPRMAEGAWGTLLVPTGKDYKISLSDGSVVHLNAFSSLRFPFNFTGKTREVVLSGEAFFTIAPNAQQSFIVHSGQTAVKVLGTAFNINAYTNSLVVTSLVQGRVITRDGNQPEVQLEPGMEAIYQEGYPNIVHPFDESITLAWRNGEYNYYNKPLGDLKAVILHWYGKQLLFENASLADKKLTGIIERDKPVTDFLDGLDKTSGLTYHINEDKIYLSTK